MIRLLAIFLKKIRVLKYFNLIAKVNINGFFFKTPLFGELGIGNLSISELWMSKILEKLVVINKGTFIDVGVNTGQTLLKIKSIKSDIKYIGFEPNPSCVFYVQQLVRINKIENTTLYPVGVADVTKLLELNFFSSASTDSSASIIADFRPGSKIDRKEIVPCFSFRDIEQSDFGSIGIIKIDVEGAELEVIQGFVERLVKDKPFILIEILPVYDVSNKERMERQEALEKIMRSVNYKLFRIHKKNEKEIEELELVEVIGIHSNMEWCDYILCHETMFPVVNAIVFE